MLQQGTARKMDWLPSLIAEAFRIGEPGKACAF
jgi:hypothetical protein